MNKILLIVPMLIYGNICCAKQESLISTTHEISLKTWPIYNLTEIVKEVKDFVKIPVLVPTVIKVEEGKLYFASTMQDNASPKNEYFITIGYTPGCNAHVCTLGYMRARENEKIETDQGVKYVNDQMTLFDIPKTTVSLNNNIKGYFTPAFEAATSVDPKIQWEYKGVLYTLSWATATQDDLVKMANSAIESRSSNK